jgi:hypothetical protein
VSNTHPTVKFGDVVRNWPTLRFDQIAHNIAERIDPAEADTDIYVGPGTP